MSAVHPNSVQSRSAMAELRQSVELVLSGVNGPGSPVAAIRRRTFPQSTSYSVEIVTVELATGDPVDIFLKDFGRSSLPKDAAVERRERELRVYQDLLEGRELGTARFYGARWEEAAARFWLMLELVEGRPLRDCSFERWPAAIGWLGRLRGSFAAQRAQLGGCEFLVRHDADFFVRAAQGGLEALSRFSKTLASRLEAVLEGYDAVLAVLSRDADTLVHGSYRPHNVLVARSSEPVRICPTDWELAAFGRSAYDLAFVCDGFRAPQLDTLFDAYDRELDRSGLPVPDRDELRHEVDCFRLHKMISSLGHLCQWPRPAVTAAKVVGAAEEIAGTLS